MYAVHLLLQKWVGPARLRCLSCNNRGLNVPEGSPLLYTLSQFLFLAYIVGAVSLNPRNNLLDCSSTTTLTLSFLVGRVADFWVHLNPIFYWYLFIHSPCPSASSHTPHHHQRSERGNTHPLVGPLLRKEESPKIPLQRNYSGRKLPQTHNIKRHWLVT